MTQWIDQPGPDDQPVVRVEDELEGNGEGGGERRRPGGVRDVHADVTRDRELYTEDEGAVDDDVADRLSGDERPERTEPTEPAERDGGEPAKRHGDPLVPREDDQRE